MKDPEEKEMMAYIAGLIDGDGNIGLRNGPRGKLSPVIQFHNSSKQSCVFLHNLFGGNISSDKPKKEGHQIVWRWMLQGVDGCKNFISKVGMYLIIKKDSSDLLMEFFENPSPIKNYHEISKDLNISRKLKDLDLNNLNRSMNRDNFFWAYVAGIMDTDGSFSIERSVRKPEKENRQVNDLIKYRPKILLTMVTDNAIKYILSNCSLGGYSIVEAKTALRGKACRLSISSRSQAIEFLKLCIPYLQIKAVRAVKLLNFCRNYKPTNGLAKIPEEEKEYRENCYKEIMLLNNTPS